MSLALHDVTGYGEIGCGEFIKLIFTTGSPFHFDPRWCDQHAIGVLALYRKDRWDDAKSRFAAERGILQGLARQADHRRSEAERETQHAWGQLQVSEGTAQSCSQNFIAAHAANEAFKGELDRLRGEHGIREGRLVEQLREANQARRQAEEDSERAEASWEGGPLSALPLELARPREGRYSPLGCSRARGQPNPNPNPSPLGCSRARGQGGKPLSQTSPGPTARGGIVSHRGY